MATMKQVFLTAPKEVAIQEVERPVATPGTVLIRVHYCGICGTDLMNYRGEIVWGRDKYPKAPGHELSGTIEAVGDGVKNFKPGDRVVAECTIGCGQCETCKMGNYSLCRSRMSYSNGAMAEYVAIPAKAVYPVPENIDLLEASVIEPVAVGCMAARKCGDVFGKNVGIIGAGTIGLGSVMTFNIGGAAKIFAFDLRDDRLDLAKQVGATDVVNGAKQDTVAVVRELTGGRGLDAVIVASAGTSKTVSLAMALVAPLGTVSIVGLSGGQMSEIDADDLSEKEALIVGSHSSPGIWERLIACIAAGRYPLRPLISHVLPIDKADEAFKLLVTPSESTQKVVLKMA